MIDRQIYTHIQDYGMQSAIDEFGQLAVQNSILRDGIAKAHIKAKEAEEENAALREALRLKELECESLNKDVNVKQNALEFIYESGDYSRQTESIIRKGLGLQIMSDE